MIAYAISDPSTLNFNTLQHDLSHFLNKASMITYRDKAGMNYEENAKLFLKYANGFDKVLLHGNYMLAKKLGADGVHLKSTQFSDIQKAKHLALFVVVSTHTIEELKEAEALGADMATFSPVFDTPNKGLALGLEILKSATSQVNIPVLALGGILNEDQIRVCEKAGAVGFASIRYFA
ncbi:MAG: thiamine phosphate synthase [Sulfurovum sp.]|nr:thiamine phosphate synthase [Sulfurovum sp.]